MIPAMISAIIFIAVLVGAAFIGIVIRGAVAWRGLA